MTNNVFGKSNYENAAGTEKFAVTLKKNSGVTDAVYDDYVVGDKVVVEPGIITDLVNPSYTLTEEDIIKLSKNNLTIQVDASVYYHSSQLYDHDYEVDSWVESGGECGCEDVVTISDETPTAQSIKVTVRLDQINSVIAANSLLETPNWASFHSEWFDLANIDLPDINLVAIENALLAFYKTQKASNGGIGINLTYSQIQTVVDHLTF